MPEQFDPQELAYSYMTAPGEVVELIQFEYHFSSLIWLWRMMDHSIKEEVGGLQAFYASGGHRVPGWEYESDLALEESIGALEGHAAPISAGVIIVACASALESLLTDLLYVTESTGNDRQQGLTRKARIISNALLDDDSSAAFMKHIKWIADRRNSFAHRLIDEGGDWDPSGTRFSFDADSVEEIFVRIGEIASMLNIGHKRYRSTTGHS